MKNALAKLAAADRKVAAAIVAHKKTQAALRAAQVAQLGELAAAAAEHAARNLVSIAITSRDARRREAGL